MISCRLNGGLGNKLFQIAKVISLAEASGQSARFDFNDTVVHQGKPASYYRDNILFNITELSHEDKPYYYQEGDGYWQSEKHFENIKYFIVPLFSNEEILLDLHKRYKDILEDSISIHVRRGDYLQTGDVLPESYYYRALNLAWGLCDIKNILVFSDDIEWCKNEFLYGTMHYIEGLKDYEDMYLMSLCSNNIVANSSFSWWGSYLNTNPKKYVFAPEPWTAAHDDSIYYKQMIRIAL
jgi:hypothetical protein